MATQHVQGNLYWQLLRFAINAKHGLMKIAEQHGLTVMQLYTLCLLEADNSIQMNSLAGQLNCDASNITGIIDRLLAQEYIRREECERDRRIKLITLTPKGEALSERILEELTDYQPANLKQLDTRQKQAVLDAVADALQPLTTKTNN